MGVTKHQWASDEKIIDAVRETGTVVGASKVLNVGREALRHRIRSRNLEYAVEEARQEHVGPIRKENDDRAYLYSADQKEWTGDLKDFVSKRGLDPADWVILRTRLNEWGHDGEPFTQIRVDLAPRALEALMPARTEGWKPPKKLPEAPKRDGELVVFFGDQHCPHHDVELHQAACQWLRTNKPDRGILLGDILDFDVISRHRYNPEWSSTMQDCIDTSYQVLLDYVQASPGTKWQLLSGNHEARLRNAVIDNLLNMYGLRRATADGEQVGEAVLSVQHLLRLDELGIEWVNPNGEYEHGQIRVNENLAARHGWIATRKSGTTALKTLEHLGHSVVVGHSHRMSEVYLTKHDIDGKCEVLTGVECGTMATLNSYGLGYSVAPDWQAGFATATTYDDGKFSIDLAKYIDGSLMWRDQRIGTNGRGT